MLRLTKAQLDGACSDPRFEEEFFIDLIFAPVEKPNKTGGAGNVGSGTGVVGVGGTGGVGATQTPSDSGLVIDLSSADKYEQSLHRDTRFWDAVAARKVKSKKRRSRKYVSNSNDQFIIDEAGETGSHDEEMDSIRFSAVSTDRAAVSSSGTYGWAKHT